MKKKISFVRNILVCEQVQVTQLFKLWIFEFETKVSGKIYKNLLKNATIDFLVYSSIETLIQRFKDFYENIFET